MCCSEYNHQPGLRESPFSYFSLFGLCFDQACRDQKIKADCQTQAENASTGDMEADTAFVNDCIKQAQQSTTSPSSSSPDTLNKGLTALEQILCIANPKNCPNKTTSPGSGTSATPPPKPATSKFLGMPTPLGIGVALAVTATLFWVGFKYLGHPKVVVAPAA